MYVPSDKINKSHCRYRGGSIWIRDTPPYPGDLALVASRQENGPSKLRTIDLVGKTGCLFPICWPPSRPRQAARHPKRHFAASPNLHTSGLGEACYEPFELPSKLRKPRNPTLLTRGAAGGFSIRFRGRSHSRGVSLSGAERGPSGHHGGRAGHIDLKKKTGGREDIRGAGGGSGRCNTLEGGNNQGRQHLQVHDS